MTDLTPYKELFDNAYGATTRTEVRENAFSRFMETGLPTKRMEDWRYSDIKALNNTIFDHDVSPASSIKPPAALTDWPRIVLLDGKIISKDGLPQGVTLSDVNLSKCAKTEDSLSHLNNAFSNGGVSIHVDANVDAGSIEMVILYSGQENDARHITNTITLEEGSSLNMMQLVVGGDILGLKTLENSISLASKSTFTHYQDLEGNEIGFINIHDHLTNNDGAYQQYSLLSRAKSARHTLTMDQMAEGSDLTLNGAFLARKGETLDTLTRVSHLVPRATSDQIFKNIVAKGGKSTFQGKVVVAKDAQETLADQSCKNLLLDRSAEANVKPELLIYADDVKCSHGATIGELDENALFYMKQRGIPEATARGILVRAFLSEAFASINDEIILAHFENQVESWMISELGQVT